MSECRTCEGLGYIYCDMGYEHSCEACGSTGEIESDEDE
jgi:hypothetical protein